MDNSSDNTHQEPRLETDSFEPAEVEETTAQEAETVSTPEQVVNPIIKVSILAGMYGDMMVKAAGFGGNSEKGRTADKLLAAGFKQLGNFLMLGEELDAAQAKLFENTIDRAKAMYLETGADKAEIGAIMDPVRNTFTYLTKELPMPEPESFKFPKTEWVSTSKPGDPDRRAA